MPATILVCLERLTGQIVTDHCLDVSEELEVFLLRVCDGGCLVIGGLVEGRKIYSVFLFLFDGFFGVTADFTAHFN